jgi:hypothetical protein
MICVGIEIFNFANLILNLMELEYIEHLSPMLKGDIKNYLIDIDGTITDDVPNEEPERMVTCEPFPDALETINKWYDEGHQICFFTSRTEDLRQITENGWTNTDSNITAC